MQKHKCKLCSKSFCNGRALGGHMKSHLVSPTRKRLGNSVYSSSSSSDVKSLVYGLRENPRRSFRVVNPDPESSTVYQNSETETEPETGDPVRKKRKAKILTKKSKRSKQKKSSPEPASSVSDGSPEQDLAICLMMLSRDSREQLKKPELRQCPEVRGCVIDLNLPPPQDGDVVTFFTAL